MLRNCCQIDSNHGFKTHNPALRHHSQIINPKSEIHRSGGALIGSY